MSQGPYCGNIMYESDSVWSQYTSNHNSIFIKHKGVQSQITAMAHLSRTGQSRPILFPQYFKDSGLIMKQHPHQYTGVIRSVLAPEGNPHHQGYISVMPS